MAPRLTIKNNAWESMLLRARVVMAFVLVVCLSMALFARLVDLQVLEYDHFKTLSHENRVKIVPVAPTRGLIFDRNGVLLAQNTPTFSLEVLPEAVDDMDAVLAELKGLVDIREVDERRFRQLVQEKRRFEYVTLRSRLSDAEVARLAVNRHRFPGVEVRARLSRDYPLGSLGVHVVGYVGRISERELRQVDSANYWGTDQYGKSGVEQSYENVLHGKVGYEHVETNAQGRRLRVLERKPPVPGNHVFLTIDASLQAVAEAALGEENGAVVAIEPETGDVLAFASVPGFDPNEFVDGIEAANYRALLTSPDRPLFNRALYGRYPPGSTVKPFVALGGLDEGVEQATSDIWCGGWYRLEGGRRRYRDWKEWGHGRVDLHTAITESCDVYFYQLAHELGIERLHKALDRFGFGRRTGIDLKGEVAGLNPSPQWKRRARGEAWFPGETLIAGIGQGFTLVTPLQLAAAAATLSLRGTPMTPHVAGRLLDPLTGEESIIAPEPLEPLRLDDPTQWKPVVDAMVDVVHGKRGTARRIGVDAGYRIAGKTGTAQVIGVGEDEEYDEETLDKRLRDHALFIAFAPPAQPRIAVAVIVENGGSGSKTAAPVARTIMDHYLLRTGEGQENGLLLSEARRSGPEGEDR
ncbi:MAG: penicillin-binding protein 2 [Gammaproteobacteria bacterium]|nr:penicillin-binding protein 2 [Gammaproteobacteria bacterium]NIR84220.1 penicillin-binding protein 2 [Gammaproteobacteria bacterium]NIR89690.1 penicillin-binding protein 2 [Gammaproteobacteria bacterium]NIU05378.1 penicillin-binding protein 2 [Gammaproteobacteria bacterium]NIV52324.1 penicillin-binding protein 2 [Gammaproteobacteria bacterium]